MQVNRAQETPETRTNRRISKREKMLENRAQETPEASATRRISNREKGKKTEHKELQKHVLTAAFQTGKKCK